jgi:hypothetical protein
MFVVVVAVMILFVSCAPALVVLETEKCDNTREAVAECALHFLDLNRDGNITRSEATTGLSRMSHIPCCGMNVDYLFKCDFDNDTMLTAIDWAWPRPNTTDMNITASRCLPTTTCLVIACDVCIKNGFVMADTPERRKRRGLPTEGEFRMHTPTDPKRPVESVRIPSPGKKKV